MTIIGYQPEARTPDPTCCMTCRSANWAGDYKPEIRWRRGWTWLKHNT